MEKTINDLKEIRSKIHEASLLIADATIMANKLSYHGEFSDEELERLVRQAEAMNDVYEMLLDRQIVITQLIKTQLSQV